MWKRKIKFSQYRWLMTIMFWTQSGALQTTASQQKASIWLSRTCLSSSLTWFNNEELQENTSILCIKHPPFNIYCSFLCSAFPSINACPRAPPFPHLLLFRLCSSKSLHNGHAIASSHHPHVPRAGGREHVTHGYSCCNCIKISAAFLFSFWRNMRSRYVIFHTKKYTLLLG